MKCKACGAEISETNKFCGICGAANIIEKEGINSDPSKGEKEEGVLSSALKEKRERDEIDDILNSYGRKSEESGLSAESDGEDKVSENAAGEKRENESADNEKENGAYSPQNENPHNNGQIRENPQINNVQAGANPQYNRGGNVNMPYGGYPQNTPNGYYGPYVGGYPQPPFPPPYPQPYPQDTNPQAARSDKGGKNGKTKEKHVVSVGIAVFCIILVLFLSAMCGYLTEVCFRNGINPLKPFTSHSIILVDGNRIEGELHNG